MTPDIYIHIFDWVRHRRFMISGWIIGLMIFVLGWFV